MPDRSDRKPPTANEPQGNLRRAVGNNAKAEAFRARAPQFFVFVFRVWQIPISPRESFAAVIGRNCTPTCWCRLSADRRFSKNTGFGLSSRKQTASGNPGSRLGIQDGLIFDTDIVAAC